MDRQVNLKNVIEIIDEKIDVLKQQNGVGALMSLAGWANDNVNTVIESNKTVIKEKGCVCYARCLSFNE